MTYRKWVGLWVAVFGCFLSATVKAQGVETLTLYGVEIARLGEITLADFERIAVKSKKATSVLWRYPNVDYPGVGDVVLAGYSTDRRQAETMARAVPGSKILEIRLSPILQSERNQAAVYAFPMFGSDDSVVGDLWALEKGGKPRRLEEGVLLGAVPAENMEVLKIAGFSDNGTSVVYCLGRCWRYDLRTSKRTAHAKLDESNRKNILGAAAHILEKSSCPRSCADETAMTFTQRLESSGYFRGACQAGEQTVPIEIRLRHEAEGWKIVSNPPNCK